MITIESKCPILEYIFIQSKGPYFFSKLKYVI